MKRVAALNSCPFGAAPSRRLPSCAPGQLPLQRLTLERGRCRSRGPLPTVHQAEDAVRIVRAEFANRPQESFVILHLNTANQVLAAVEIALGAIGSVMVDPRLVLGSALAAGVPNILLAHNHPSGSVEPSAEDDRLTAALQTAAKAVYVTLLDHVILGENGRFFSYSEAGLLPR